MPHLLALSVALAAPVPKDGRALRDAEPPKEWKLADLAAALPRRDDTGPVRVLAWAVIDTKRGFVVEKALVVKELADAADGGERFVLGYLYRHPKAEASLWRRAEVSGTAVKPNGVPITVFTEGIATTAQPPTDAEVEGLMARMHWADTLAADAERTPELKAGGVVHANWKAALDRPPPAKLFPEFRLK